VLGTLRPEPMVGSCRVDFTESVAEPSEAYVLINWTLRSWVRIPLKAWMSVVVFLCCVILCRYMTG
jgi:hypothetical protein